MNTIFPLFRDCFSPVFSYHGSCYIRHSLYPTKHFAPKPGKYHNKSTNIEQTINNTESQPSCMYPSLTLLLTSVLPQSSPSQKPLCQFFCLVFSGTHYDVRFFWRKKTMNKIKWINRTMFQYPPYSHLSAIHISQYFALYVTMHGLTPDKTVPAKSRYTFKHCVIQYFSYFAPLLKI